MRSATYHPVSAIAVGKGYLESLGQASERGERGNGGDELHLEQGVMNDAGIGGGVGGWWW